MATNELKTYYSMLMVKKTIFLTQLIDISDVPAYLLVFFVCITQIIIDEYGYNT